MDILEGLIETGNAGRSGWRIVNNNGTIGVFNNRTSNVLFSILNDGSIGASSNISSNFINSYSNINVITNYVASSGGSSQWTSSGTKIYYNTSNVGIGTIDPIVPLHIYNTSNVRLLVDTTTTGTATVEFRRGIGADMQNDYRFINDTDGNIKLQFENSTQAFSNLSANLAWFSSNETIIHKNTTMNGRVGIGTTYNSTRALDVLGNANISGTLSVTSSNSIITNSLTSNTSFVIHNGVLPPPPPITSSPSATTTGVTGLSTSMVFTYTTETAGAGTRQTQYTLNVVSGNTVCDILIVGGGGGGGDPHGGGGGAGQLVLIYQATLNGTYTIKVGNGGTGGVFESTPPKKGSDSVFSNSSTTVIAEGGGANTNNAIDKNGGSGAGGDAYNPGGGTAGGGTKNTTVDLFPGATVYSRGNNGGNQGGTNLRGGGGGGAGQEGQSGLFSIPGKGGDGLLGISEIGYDFQTNFGNFGSLEADGKYYFAGGGGGGNSTVLNGGKGGGGTGGIVGNYPANLGVSAIANTGGGGGGGGGGGEATGGTGGSGIVIIRYLNPSSITSSSIELIRGTAADTNRDYKLGNYGDEFKIISSTSNIDTDYVRISSTGAIFNPTGTASWNTGSDRRIKENIERASYDKCYENINKLELNRFNYVEGFNTVSRDNKQLGFIAQEVYDIFPKAISSQGYYSDTLSIPNLLSIDVSQINYSLYGTVKKLIEINKEKDKRIKTLGYQLKTLETFLNITVDTSSNIALDTSNITLDTSNLLDTSNNSS
uniref:Peptidase S74 domain-containing protein n=1 Tax=viral metagenome TaxID=1070528 RepID=A0A6C0KAH9_9ZZZZ